MIRTLRDIKRALRALGTPSDGDVLVGTDGELGLGTIDTGGSGGVQAVLSVDHVPVVGGTKILEVTVPAEGFYRIEACVYGTVDYGISPFIDGSLGAYMVAPLSGDYGPQVQLENRGNNTGITVFKTGGSPSFLTTHDIPVSDLNSNGNFEGILESSYQDNYYHLGEGTVELWVNDTTSNIGVVGGGRTILAGSNIRLVPVITCAVPHVG